MRTEQAPAAAPRSAPAPAGPGFQAALRRAGARVVRRRAPAALAPAPEPAAPGLAAPAGGGQGKAGPGPTAPPLAARAAATAILAERLASGAALELRFGEALHVRLVHTAGGLELALRAGPGGRGALPALLGALRARGLRVASAAEGAPLAR